MADSIESGHVFIMASDNSINKGNKSARIARTICHTLFTVHHICANVYGVILISQLFYHKEDLLRAAAVYAAAFGTNWNFTFQTIFLALALLHDVLEWTDRSETTFGSKIRYWRDIVFSSLVFPFTLFVTCMFWCVYFIDRELVFPRVFDDEVPFWFNHCVHTNIFVVIALETLLQPRRKPADVKLERILCLAVSFGYAVVYYSIYFFADRWLYQVFGVLNWWQICLYQSLIWISNWVFYLIQYPINRLIHSDPGVIEIASDKGINEEVYKHLKGEFEAKGNEGERRLGEVYRNKLQVRNKDKFVEVTNGNQIRDINDIRRELRERKEIKDNKKY